MREALVGTVINLAVKPIDVGSAEVSSMAKEQAKDLAKNLLSDFLNGDLKADEAGMHTILNKLFDTPVRVISTTHIIRVSKLTSKPKRSGLIICNNFSVKRQISAIIKNQRNQS